MNSKKKTTASPGATEFQRKPRLLLRIALIIAAYLLAFILLDIFSLRFEELPGVVAWYPPVGLTYALLLVFGVKFAPAVTIALLISSLFIYRIPQSPYLLIVGAGISSLIYGLAAAFLRQRIHFDWQLGKFRHVVWLVFTAGIVSAILAVLSVSGTNFSSAVPRSEVLRAIFDWWVGETVGVLTVTPFLLIYVMPVLKRFAEGQPVRLPKRGSFPRPTLSAIGQASSLALMLYLVFGVRLLDEYQPLYLISLPIIWIALQRGFKGVSVAILVLNIGVVLALMMFRFDLALLGELQLLMIVNCIVGLLMGAVVTERKQVTEKLEEERILLHTLIDNLPDRIFVMDSQGRKLISNLADWQASRGKSMQEVIGKSDFDTYPPEMAQVYWALDKAVIDSGIPTFNVEEPGLDSHGNPACVLSSKVPLRDGQGKVVGLVGIGRDITERKQREDEIRSSTEELSALYQLSRALADANDLKNVIELVNRQAVESVHTTFACIALLENGDLVTGAVYPVRVLEHDFAIGGRQPLSALPGCQRILDGNEPVIFHAGSPEVSSTECAPLMLDFAQSVCLVPLRVGDASQHLNPALGLLILGEVRQEEREPFTPGKIRLARSIGDQAAAAIRRMLLFEQSGRRLQHLASLSEIDRSIASIFDLRVSLQIILKHVCEQLKVDAADVLVFNDHLQTLEFSSGRGFLSPALEHKRLRLGEGQAGQAALKRCMVSIPDVAAGGTIFAQPELMLAEQVAAYFAMPLITKGQVKGILEIYHRSPLEPSEEWLDFLNTLAGRAAIAIDNIQLFEGLQRSNSELELAYDATIEGWSHALDLRDNVTEGHTLRVAEMTVNLARSLGLDERDLVQVRRGGLLHDIGKMGVPDGILLKPGALTDEEWLVMKKHPTLAFEMLSNIRYLRLALNIPYCHHEKWDGTGYPRGLKGEQIPFAARIFAVVDVYDALTSDRPYRKAWSKEKALQHIQAGAGTHFDPQVVKIFLLESGQ